MSTEAASPSGVTPYITPEGNLIIPFAADERYHHWRGGQSLAATLLEIGAPFDVWRRYTAADEILFTEDAPDQCVRCGKPLALACGGEIKVCVKCNRYRRIKADSGEGQS
jgi:hypothetical protein